MCHCHSLCNPVAPLGFSSLAEANVHARIGSGFIDIVVVCQDVLHEFAFVAEVFLERENETQEVEDTKISMDDLISKNCIPFSIFQPFAWPLSLLPLPLIGTNKRGKQEVESWVSVAVTTFAHFE